MGLSGRDLAILSARFGVARFGASRFGFYPDDVEGTGADEPGEYVWKEHAPPTTTWTLQSQCEGNVCGWRPVAGFSADPESGASPLSVEFTDESTPANDLDSWAWDFGDGETSTEQNPSHTYDSDGEYTVTLTVTNSKGSDSTTGSVTVISTGGISGEVSYEGSPVSGATVTLYLDDVEQDTDIVGADGLYSFTGLDPDTYEVVASADGYIDSNQEAVAVTAGVTATQDLVLTAG